MLLITIKTVLLLLNLSTQNTFKISSEINNVYENFRTKKQKLYLGEMLVRKGWLSQAELDEALSEQLISNKQLGEDINWRNRLIS